MSLSTNMSKLQNDENEENVPMSRSSVEEDADEKVNETTERDPDTTSNGSKDSTLQILRTDSSHSTSSSNSSGAVPSPSPNPDQRQGPNFPVYTSLVNEKCAESDNTQSSSALGPEHLLNVTHPAQTLRDRKRHGICSRCCNWVLCGCLRGKKPVRLQLCTLLAMLLASAFTGAAITMVVYQVIISNVRREVELGSERLLEMQSELDEIQVQILRVNHLMRARAGSNGGLNGPNYTHIDQVIDDPPNDTAARSLYYELAPFREESCCSNDPTFWRRLAVSQHMLGYVQGENNKDVLVNYLRQANTSAYFAIKIGAKDADTFCWTGIIDGLLGENNMDKRITYAASVRLKHWIDEALKLKPADPRTLTALGRYLFELASLSRVERAIGSAIFGTIPEAKMDDAIESLQRAERAFRERGRVNRQTWLTMAWCYQKKGDVNNARRYAQEAASQPVRTVFDRIEQQKLEKLLGEL